MPMPQPETAPSNANSLLRNGSRPSFNAHHPPHSAALLTVTVNFTDKANIANETQRSRKNTENSGIDDFVGAKTLGAGALKVLPGRILAADSTASSDGKGSVQRQEALQTSVAAVVTQL